MNASVIAHKAGLFSLINNLITCLEIHGLVSPDWSNSIYSGELGIDIFGRLFDALPRVPEDAPVNTPIYFDYPHQRYTYKHAALLYEDPDPAWRFRLNQEWQKLRVSKTIRERVRQFVIESFPPFTPAGIVTETYRPFLGAMVRAHTHAGEQVTARSQSLDEYFRALEKLREETKITKVFLMTQDTETIGEFCKHFDVVIMDVPRRSTRDVDRHETEPQTPEDAANVLAEVLVMSHAEALVHPVSNMATACLYINPRMRSVFLE